MAQPPLYYSVAGAWWQTGKMLGFDGGHLLYCLRFLNLVVIIALVWLGYFAARLISPGNIFLRLGVPALIAFIPQTAFYSINNDVLSPVCFGMAFICLIKFLRAEFPNVRLGIFTGLALAATFLTKISNLPLLAVSARTFVHGGETWLPEPENCAPPLFRFCSRLVARRAADGCLDGLVQKHFRRLLRHGAENPVSRLDAQAVRRMVASSDFSRRRLLVFLHGFWRPSGRANFCGIASRWRCRAWTRFTWCSRFVSLAYRAGRAGLRRPPLFTAPQRAGALVGLSVCFAAAFAFFALSVREIRFSGLLLSVARTCRILFRAG